MTVSAPASAPAATLPFVDRGPLCHAVLSHLTGDDDAAAADHTGLATAAVAASADVVCDDDIQLALFVLYASSYGSLPQLDADLEWDPALLTTRRILEEAFESALRARVPMPESPEPTVDAVGRALFATMVA